jgi:hypothetical protein
MLFARGQNLALDLNGLGHWGWAGGFDHWSTADLRHWRVPIWGSNVGIVSAAVREVFIGHCAHVPLSAGSWHTLARLVCDSATGEYPGAK